MKYILTNIVTLAQIAPASDIPPFLLGLSEASLSDLSWVDPAQDLTGLGYWPVSNEDASAIANGMVASGVDSYRIDPLNKAWVKVLGARAQTAEEQAAWAKAQASVYLDQTDVKMPRAYEDLLTATKALQPALYAALPAFTQSMHDQRMAARAVLVGG